MKHKKKLSLLLALALGATPVLTSVNSSKIFAEEKIEKYTEMTEEEIKEIERELKFYYEEVGELKDGTYKVKDFYRLSSEAKKGNEIAKLLYSKATQKSWYSFGECIVMDQIGDLIKYMNASERERINMAIKTKTWGTVANIVGAVIFRAATKYGDKVAIKYLAKLSKVVLAASLAYSAYVCRNEL